MLPVCSATPCSSHSQILLNEGLRHFSRSQKVFDVKCLSGDTAVPSLLSGVCPGASLQKEAANSLYSDFLRGNKGLRNEWHYTTGKLSDSFSMHREPLRYVEDSTGAVSQEELLGDTLTDSAYILLEPTSKEPISISDYVVDNNVNVPDALSTNTESLPSSSNSFEDFLSQSNESIGTSISQGQNVLNSYVDKVTSIITDIIKDGNEAFENLTSRVNSSVDQTGELTRNRLTNLPSDLKQASSKAGGVVVDLLRNTILVVEDSLVKGSKFVYYSYGTSKNFLPPEIQNALIPFEEKASEISRPVGKVFLQVFSTVEGLEKSLGLDPSDPIAPFVLFLGTTSTLWAVYWVVTYSGYAGDLSPKLAFELLSGKDSAVLIDVRPEDLRERDGVPDLRRAARFRYANICLPKVDGSLKKLMKSSRDLDDSLIATVIRNLKNVQDRSKVIVMDADGRHAKSIARSLRKLGVKRPYVLQGGFKSWVNHGLRVKELKPETAITILNEDAEAILEELSPTPVQLLGIGMGSVAAIYALLEWEKTLQFIGVVGLAQTMFRRLASYKNSEDFSKDVRLLLSPVRLGVQAVKRSVGKAETDGNGLPVSPSSSDVQNRVLQAAAKHESQPEASQDTLNSSAATGDSMDPSEA